MTVAITESAAASLLAQAQDIAQAFAAHLDRLGPLPGSLPAVHRMRDKAAVADVLFAAEQDEPDPADRGTVQETLVLLAGGQTAVPTFAYTGDAGYLRVYLGGLNARAAVLGTDYKERADGTGIDLYTPFGAGTPLHVVGAFDAAGEMVEIVPANLGARTSFEAAWRLANVLMAGVLAHAARDTPFHEAVVPLAAAPPAADGTNVPGLLAVLDWLDEQLRAHRRDLTAHAVRDEASYRLTGVP